MSDQEQIEILKRRCEHYEKLWREADYMRREGEEWAKQLEEEIADLKYSVRLYKQSNEKLRAAA